MPLLLGGEGGTPGRLTPASHNLAECGAEVIIGVRNLEAGKKVVEEIK